MNATHLCVDASRDRTSSRFVIHTAKPLPQRLLGTGYGSLSVVIKSCALLHYLAPHTSKGPSRTTRVDPSHPCTLISIDPVVYLPGSNLGMCFHSSPFFLCSLCTIIPPAPDAWETASGAEYEALLSRRYRIRSRPRCLPATKKEMASGMLAKSLSPTYTTYTR